MDRTRGSSSEGFRTIFNTQGPSPTHAPVTASASSSSSAAPSEAEVAASHEHGGAKKKRKTSAPQMMDGSKKLDHYMAGKGEETSPAAGGVGASLPQGNSGWAVAKENSKRIDKIDRRLKRELRQQQQEVERQQQQELQRQEGQERVEEALRAVEAEEEEHGSGRALSEIAEEDEDVIMEEEEEEEKKEENEPFDMDIKE